VTAPTMHRAASQQLMAVCGLAAQPQLQRLGEFRLHMDGQQLAPRLRQLCVRWDEKLALQGALVFISDRAISACPGAASHWVTPMMTVGVRDQVLRATTKAPCTGTL
jgi:hypothetical protein